MIRFASVLIGVKDLNIAKPFYEQVFGIEFEEFRPPFSCFTMNGIEFDIEENDANRSADREQNNVGGVKPLSFHTDDVDGFLKHVLAHGGTIIKHPENKPRGWREAKFSDLDGNIFMVEQEI